MDLIGIKTVVNRQLGRILAEKNFPEAAKPELSKIIKNLVDAKAYSDLQHTMEDLINLSADRKQLVNNLGLKPEASAASVSVER